MPNQPPVQRTTALKARRVNVDVERYGAFAEIGAGQEVARHFFQAGQASQTIAKSMSAYDMAYSDEIYGREKNGRYVCESRLMKMLEKEFTLLIRRLADKRGDKTSFFAFANTVATGTPKNPRSHGWMGIRFQSRPNGPFNDIVMHVRLLDRHRLQQQEALGILGVNLIEAAFYGLDQPEKFLSRLVENLKEGQVFIDLIRFSGPDLAAFDNRRLNLELVRRGLAEAVLFSPAGEILYIADALYGKGLIVQRGMFSPLTITHADVFEKAVKQLKSEIGTTDHAKTEILTVLETSFPKGTTAESLGDYSERIDAAGACGYHALISDFPLFYQAKRFFRALTQAPMAFVMDASKLALLFDESFYRDLEGGWMEGLGKLFDKDVKFYIYPHKTDASCMTAKLFRPKGAMGGVYDELLKNGQISDIAGCDQAEVYWHSLEVRKLIDSGDPSWRKLVPAPVAAVIDKKR